MNNYFEHDTVFTVEPDGLDDFLISVRSLPLPIVGFEEVKSLIDTFNPDEREVIDIVKPDSNDKEEFIKGADGRVSLGDIQSYPTKSVGKLISSSGSCSASMIAPNVILTAGHCVHPGGSGSDSDFYRNVYFQPSHPEHGVWYKVVKIFADSAWVNHKSYQSDFAICVTEKVMGIGDYWGIQTMVGDSAYGWTTYGYPAEGRFDGKFPYSDGGPFTRRPWEDGRLQFNLVAIDHIDFTGGSSGGPWITNGRISRGNIVVQGHDSRWGRPFHINGINSFMFDGYPGIMISPYFGSTAETFFRQVLDQI